MTYYEVNGPTPSGYPVEDAVGRAECWELIVTVVSRVNLAA